MKNVGVLGAGQLAAMLADAGRKLDLALICLCPAEPPTALHCAKLIRAEYDDRAANEQLLSQADVVTYEHEKLPTESLQRYEQAGLLRPNLAALSITQDRLLEKRYLQNSQIQTAAYANIETRDDLGPAIKAVGETGILKTRVGGYDGRGQVRIQRAEQLAEAWQTLGQQPCILERLVSFERELSIIAARNAAGQMVYYPVSENQHEDGILKLAQVRLNDPLQQQAEAMIERLMVDLDYVGVMTLELFDSNGKLIANEIAPRVHNSGHWSIEGAAASQFENHLRAITGLPLVEPAVQQRAVMLNLIGNVPDEGALTVQPNMAVHRYGKAPRPGRKLGHITLVETAETLARDKTGASFEAQLDQLLAEVEQ